MKCKACDNQVSGTAKFCGTCGQSIVAESSTPFRAQGNSSDDVNALCNHLSELAQLFRNSGLPQYLEDAVHTLAKGPQDSKWQVAIVGEKARGKTTLLNKMLGVEVAPTGPRGYTHSVAYGWNEQWAVKTANGTVQFEPPIDRECVEAHTTILGPAEILRNCVITDTQPLNEVDLDFEERIVAELVNADMYLFCVSAMQLLSQREQVLIRKRLMPLLTGEGILVVTHTDVLEDGLDHADVEKRVNKFASNELKVFVLPPGRDASPSDLMQYMTSSASRLLVNINKRWRARVVALLEAIIRDLQELEVANQEPSKASRCEDKLENLTRILKSEHSFALEEAKTDLRGRISEMRLSLRRRMESWSVEYAQNEGMNEVWRDLTLSLRDAVELYVSRLEQSLSSGVPRGLNLIGQDLGEVLETEASYPQRKDAPLSGHDKRERDLRVPGLVVASLAVLLVAPQLAPVSFATVLFARHLRKRGNESFRNRLEDSTFEAFSQWIAESEQELLASLESSVSPVREEILKRLELAVVPAASTQNTAPVSILLEKLEVALDEARL